MTLIERYIFKRAVVLTLSSLTSLVLIVWIVQALQKIDIVRTTLAAAGNIIWIAVLLIPDLAMGVLPFAIMIGSVQVLNALNSDSERAVIAASGAPRSVIVRPILLLGILAAAVTLFNSHMLGPITQNAFRDGLRSINTDAISLFIQPGRFEEIQDGLVISVGEAQGSVIESLFLSDRRDPATELTYFALEARVIQREAESYLLLASGQLHRRTIQNGAVSVIQFQSYAFDLSTLRPSGSSDWTRASERSTHSLLNPDPNDKLYQNSPSAYSQEVHQRFSDWLFCLAFALWAVVVAGQPRTNRQGPGQSMAWGLGGALACKALGFISVALIDRSEAFVPVVYAVPLSAIILNSTLIWLDVDIAELAITRKAGAGLRGIGTWTRRLLPFPSVAQGGRVGG